VRTGVEAAQPCRTVAGPALARLALDRRLAAHTGLGRPRDPRATRHGRAGALVVGAPAAQYNDRPPALVSTRAGHGALRRLRQRDRCRRTGRTPAARPGRVASASPLREGELSHLAMIGRLHYSP